MKTTFLTTIAALVALIGSTQVQIDNNIELTGNDGNRTIKNLQLPVNGTDAVNKNYVDNIPKTFNDSQTFLSGSPTVPVMDYTAVNFSEYIGIVSIMNSNCGNDVSIVNSSKLQFFMSQNVQDCLSLKINNCPIRLISVANYKILTNVDFSNNQLLEWVQMEGVDFLGTVTSVLIDNSPFIKYFSGSNESLTQESVDYILATLDANGLENGYINLGSGNNASPTGGGSNPNVLSLQSKGWDVNVN